MNGSLISRREFARSSKIQNGRRNAELHRINEMALTVRWLAQDRADFYSQTNREWVKDLLKKGA